MRARRKLIEEIADGDLDKLEAALAAAAKEPPNTSSVIFRGTIPSEKVRVKVGDRTVTRNKPQVECPPGVLLSIKPGARAVKE